MLKAFQQKHIINCLLLPYLHRTVQYLSSNSVPFSLPNDMSDDLKDRIRSHSYDENPAISQYLVNQRLLSLNPNIEQLTVRERHPSNMSAASDDHLPNDETDSHVRCFTPINELFTQYDCAICREPAINPFRCTTTEERTIRVPIDDQLPQHLCCYQCLTKYMLIHNTDCFPCPLCKQNEFYLNNMIHANDRIVREAEKLVVNCRFNCGLLGSPLALANHICPLQDHNLSGHILQSILVQNLIAEISRLTEEISTISDECTKIGNELTHVLANYNSRKDYSLQWQSDYEELLKKFKESEALNGRAFLEMDTRLQISENTNKRLRNQITGKDLMMSRLKAEKKETVRKCKSKMGLVAKHYETKNQELKTENQELSQRYERIAKEFKDLLAMSVPIDAVGADTHLSVKNDWSQTDGGSGDENSLGIRPLFAYDSPESDCISAQESDSDDEAIPQHF